jgi:oligogalacturonide transporter
VAEPQARKPGLLNYWGWGSGDLLGAGTTAVASTWLLYFYTTFCGLGVDAAAGLLAIPRIFDAFTCPLIGYISDNLRNTWIGRNIGRRKIFLMIAIPLLPSFALMWVSGQNFWYYLVTLLFFELVYNMVLIPWETLAAEMSKDYKEKAKFAGARMICAQSSAILASFLPTLIVNYLGKDSAVTFLINGAVFGGLSSLVVLLVVIFSWERPYTEQEKLIKPQPLNIVAGLMIPINMFRDLFSTLRIRAFRQHLAVYLGGYTSQDIFNAALPFFAATVMMGGIAVIGKLTIVMYTVQLISVMLAIRIVVRIGPAFAYRLAISSFIAACLLYLAMYYFLPPDFGPALKGMETNLLAGLLKGTNPTVLFWMLVPIALAGLGRGALNFIPWSVYNYLPDIDEAVTSQRREGIFAGVMTLVRKLAQAGTIYATGWVMKEGGYVKGGVTQTPEAIHVVVLVLVAGPIVVMLLGLLVALKFRLSAKTHVVLMKEIDRLRNGATTPETPESGAVVEDLTGWKYADLWGRRFKPKV